MFQYAKTALDSVVQTACELDTHKLSWITITDYRSGDQKVAREVREALTASKAKAECPQQHNKA